jgi:hypothetical protein
MRDGSASDLPGIMKSKNLADRLGWNTVAMRQPLDTLIAVDQQVLGPNAGVADDRLATHSVGYGLDQRAFGPVDVFHIPVIATSNPYVPGSRQSCSARLSGRVGDMKPFTPISQVVIGSGTVLCLGAFIT